MHFWEKVRRDLESWEPENFKNTQTFYYWPRNNWENQVLPRSELQTPGRPVWPTSRAELRCQTNNLFVKQLICSQRILSTRHHYRRSQYMPAFFGVSRLRFFSLLIGCKCTGQLHQFLMVKGHILGQWLYTGQPPHFLRQRGHILGRANGYIGDSTGWLLGGRSPPNNQPIFTPTKFPYVWLG